MRARRSQVFALLLVSWILAPGAAAEPLDPLRSERDRRGQSEPLRLSLLDPRELALLPASDRCESLARDEASRDRFLEQMGAAALPFGRRITLHAFSRWGCAPTAGAGAGASYRLELSPQLALVLAGGIAVFPHASARGWLVKPSIRADLQWTLPGGRKLRTGIEGVEVLKTVLKAGSQRRLGASIGGKF